MGPSRRSPSYTIRNPSSNWFRISLLMRGILTGQDQRMMADSGALLETGRPTVKMGHLVKEENR
jgi:hypothetical protein